MKDYDLENRRLVLSAVAIGIVVIYVIRLFALQIASDDYRKSADSNAFLKKIEFPSRGSITDRKGRLLVYNQPAYDIMVVTNEKSLMGSSALPLCYSCCVPFMRNRRTRRMKRQRACER